jgi:membrane-bound serine protease (ClpP class)
MMGEVCEVKSPLDPRGRVFVQGEVWKAEVSDGKTSISVGEKVRVTGVEGLTLFVEPI